MMPCSNMEMIIRKETNMNLHIDDGVQFGLGAFETIAVEKNKPVFLERHLQRLQHAADVFDLGNLENRQVTVNSIEDYLNSTYIEHGALKIILTKENVIFSDRKSPYTSAHYENGFTSAISSIRRNETSPLTFHKTLNYGDNILEKRAAINAGINEKIFLNTKGQICEGTVSNIFFVKEKKLYTPTLSCGLLPGILRAYILETYDVKETILYPEDLVTFDECFLTNSLMGIMPLFQIENVAFKERTVTNQLRKSYLEMYVNHPGM